MEDFGFPPAFPPEVDEAEVEDKHADAGVIKDKAKGKKVRLIYVCAANLGSLFPSAHEDKRPHFCK